MSLCSSVVPSPAAHPRILINTTIPEELSTEECTHHLYLSLPPLIFFDKFEEFFAVKHNFTLYSPSPDLELPAHALTSQDDTSLVIHLAPGTLDSNGQRLEVPLHIRYAQPRAGGGYQHLTLSWPTLFSICKRTSEGQPSDFATLPSVVQRSLDSKSSVVYSHPPCASGGIDTVYTFRAPVGDLDHLQLVQVGTAFIVLVCFIWLGRALLDVLTSEATVSSTKQE